MDKEQIMAVAKINDRLRRAMSLGQLNLNLSESVEGSPMRPAIIKAVRDYTDFDPELDIEGDHSVGIVIVAEDAFVFRFTYGDERYDYAKEVGRRTLSIMHATEFRSLRLGRKIHASVRRMMGEELG